MEPISLAPPVFKEIFENAPKLVRRLLNTKLQIIVVGFRASGKTTFVRRLQGRATNMMHVPTSGEDLHRRRFKYKKYREYDAAARNIAFTTISDLSGERSAWPLWDRAFTRIRPDGIIFVVDGLVDRSTFEYQKQAMKFFIDFLGVKDRSWLVFKGDHRKARDQLRAVMFLYNKMDIWAPQGYTIGHFMAAYNYERMRIEDLVPGAVIDEPCSALFGINFHEAMAAFIARMLEKR